MAYFTQPLSKLFKAILDYLEDVLLIIIKWEKQDTEKNANMIQLYETKFLKTIHMHVCLEECVCMHW